jgi:hypothetical protein
MCSAQCLDNLALLRYSPSDLFDTYPLPADLRSLEAIGNEFCDRRQEVMLERQEGLTTIYNRLHDRTEISKDIVRLRLLHTEMDRAVAAAYGWSDLDLSSAFHETKQGVRFTISELARRTVLNRLLALNHERHAEEEIEKAAQAVAAPAKRGRKKRDRADKLTLDLL